MITSPNITMVTQWKTTKKQTLLLLLLLLLLIIIIIIIIIIIKALTIEQESKKMFNFFALISHMNELMTNQSNHS